MAALYRDRYSCPVSCPLRPITADESAILGVPARPGACYAYNRAAAGRAPSPMDMADRGQAGEGIPAEWSRPVGAAGALPSDTAVRLCVSGDLLRPESGPDGSIRMVLDRAFVESVDRIATDRPDIRRRGILAYTHAWRDIGDARQAFRHGWAPQASCDSIADTVKARALGYAPVLTLPESDPDQVIGSTIPGAGRVIPCLSQARDIACADCMLCARPERPSVVAFTAHGATRSRVKGEAQ